MSDEPTDAELAAALTDAEVATAVERLALYAAQDKMMTTATLMNEAAKRLRRADKSAKKPQTAKKRRDGRN